MSGPRVVIVGAGLMGRWHAHAARRCGGRIHAVVDPDAPRAAALAVASGASARGSLEAALRGEDVDVVHVCTPAGTHEALVEEALGAGCHALVEKPFAADAAATRRLLGLAGGAGRMLWPVHQFLFQPGVLWARDLGPSLGTLRSLEHRVCSAGAEGRSEAERDAVALEILPHPLALAARFCAAPIAGGDWHVRRAAPGELLVTGVVGGTAVSAQISMAGRPPVNQLRLVWERGTVQADLFHGFAYLERGTASRSGKVTRPFTVALRQAAAASANLLLRALRSEPAYPGLRELIGRCYAAAAGEGPDPVPAAETLAVAEVWDELKAETAVS